MEGVFVKVLKLSIIIELELLVLLDPHSTCLKHFTNVDVMMNILTNDRINLIINA